MRIWPAVGRGGEDVSRENGDLFLTPADHLGSSFHVDWIRLTRGPVILRVTGCYGEKYFTDSSSEADQRPDTSTVIGRINGILETWRTAWKRKENDLPRARTYNCQRGGGEIITLEGHDFGGGGVGGLGAPAHVYIDGLPCARLQHNERRPQESLTCITPPMDKLAVGGGRVASYSVVKIRNGKLPGLDDAVPFLQYADHPPAPRDLHLSNIAARSVGPGSSWPTVICPCHVGYKDIFPYLYLQSHSNTQSAPDRSSDQSDSEVSTYPGASGGPSGTT